MLAPSITLRLTFHNQGEALCDGHFQGLMGNAACEPFPRVPERSLEVEEARQREGHVPIFFVVGKEDILQ